MSGSDPTEACRDAATVPMRDYIRSSPAMRASSGWRLEAEVVSVEIRREA